MDRYFFSNLNATHGQTTGYTAEVRTLLVTAKPVVDMWQTARENTNKIVILALSFCSRKTFKFYIS